MDNKKVIIASAVTFGAMALGATNASADQVKTADTAPAIQTTSSVGSSLQARTFTLMASPASSSSVVDDGTGTDINDGTGSTTDPSDGGSTTKPGDGGTTTNPGDTGSTTDPSDGGTTTTPGDTGSTTDPNTGTGTTDPSTGTDTGSNGSTTQPDVTPVPVQPDNSGQVVNVPVAVQGKQAVAQAVTSYNQALADNNGDSTAEPVVQAKANLDKAIADTLPETGMNKQAGMSVAGIALLAIASGLKLYKSRKFI